MPCELRPLRQFVKDAQRLRKAGWDMQKLQEFLLELRKSPPLPAQYAVHPLQGDMRGIWDAHISHNWIVLFRQNAGVIELLRTGTHAALKL